MDSRRVSTFLLFYRGSPRTPCPVPRFSPSSKPLPPLHVPPKSGFSVSTILERRIPRGNAPANSFLPPPPGLAAAKLASRAFEPASRAICRQSHALAASPQVLPAPIPRFPRGNPPFRPRFHHQRGRFLPRRLLAGAFPAGERHTRGKQRGFDASRAVGAVPRESLENRGVFAAAAERGGEADGGAGNADAAGVYGRAVVAETPGGESERERAGVSVPVREFGAADHRVEQAVREVFCRLRARRTAQSNRTCGGRDGMELSLIGIVLHCVVHDGNTVLAGAVE